MLDANPTLKVIIRMNEQRMPVNRTSRVSLTKSQLRTDLGAQLLSLCESVTADGKLAPEEAQGLREWLDEANAADLPAAAYLREVVARVLADGQITSEDCREVYRAVESVLPPEVRRQATAARKEVEAVARRRDMPIVAANFMVAGVRHEGRGEVIARYANAGDPVCLVRDRGNRYSCFAVAVLLENGEQIGFVPEEDAQLLAPLLDEGVKYAAWMTKILGSGRVPIPVVQAKLYRRGSTVDVEAMSRSFRRSVVTIRGDRLPQQRTGPSGMERSELRGWFWIAAGVILLAELFSTR